MKVRVESTVGLATPVEIEVQPPDSIIDVKEKIAAAQACDADSIALQWNGKTLDERFRVKDYGVKEGDTITVIPKSREGGRTLPLSFLKQRLSLESQAIRREGINLKPLNPFHWVGIIEGRGRWKGQHRISILIPRDYPYSPPIVKWETPLEPRHPNISSGGLVCINILSKDWRPQYTLITVYRSLEWLLENPNYEDSFGNVDGVLSGILRRFF